MNGPIARLCMLVLALLVLGLTEATGSEALTFVRHDVTAGDYPTFVAVADFNRDGKEDLAATNSRASNVSVLLGDGRGGFSARSDFATGAGPQCVAVGDLNGDGKKDLVTASAYGTLSVLLGDGSGGFGTSTDYPVAAGTLWSAAVGDFDGDGKQDVVVSSGAGSNENHDGRVSILLGDGSGGLGTKTDFPTGDWPAFLAVADFNADGREDVVTANRASSTISVLLCDGNGGLGDKTDYVTAVGDYPSSIAVRDLNGDGKKDLVVSNSWSLRRFYGDGSGGFVPNPSDLGPEHGPWSVVVGDFNGDAKQDFATSGLGYAVRVWLDEGKGAFRGSWEFPTGGPFCLAVADFNRDRRPDLVTANGGTTLSVLRNTTKPVVLWLSPSRGRAGTVLTIRRSYIGWSFGASRGTSKVYFGTKAATKYISWSKSLIKVWVPALPKGKKAVTVRTSFGRSNVKYFTVL